MNILILGDSWSADWNIKYTDYLGWPNIIAQKYAVTNIAQAGVSQYSILKQLDTIQPLDYDIIIISITSPYRVYTPQHPVHTSGLHANSDLIYSDIDHHASKFPDNKRLHSALAYFEDHYDLDYADTIHHNMVDNCLNRLDPRNTIVTSNIKNNVNFVGGHLFVDGHEISNSYPGLINHTSEEGNQIFAKEIIKLINEKVDK